LLDLEAMNNPFGDSKVISNCSIFGMMEMSGQPVEGGSVVEAISNMKERSNGLGAGFAVYGCYPEHQDDYALHVMYDSEEGKELTESRLSQTFEIVGKGEIPTEPNGTMGPAPLLWRYFLVPRNCTTDESALVADEVSRINDGIKDAFVFSAAKNMGVFKGIGYPRDLAEFYRLREYRGYIWLAHGRFPTNTMAWWGGAHPFSMLDWTVVHNGEISSYGTNRRFVETYGYRCSFLTDTEVVAYAIDLLVRVHGLPLELAAQVLAPPLWDQIDVMDPGRAALYRSLRSTYAGLLLNGPFSVIVAREGEMVGLTDRIRLRPLTAGIAGDRLYLSSEEAPLRLVDDDLTRVWSPQGGVPIVGRLGEGVSYDYP